MESGKISAHVRRQSNLFRRVTTAVVAVGLAVAFSLIIPVATAPAHAAAGINSQINFQGKLVNPNGTNVPDGTYNLQFKIYQDGDGLTAADATGSPAGSLKWTESRLRNNTQGVTVTNGIFQVNLGAVNAFGNNIDWNQDTIWLSINIGNTNATCTPFSSCTPDGEMLPMIRFTAAPYASNAGALGGLASSQFVQLAQGVQTDSSTANASIAINKTGGTASILDLQRGGADVLLIDNSGYLTFKPATGLDSATALQVKTADGLTTVLDVDTANKRIGIGVNNPAAALAFAASTAATGGIQFGTDATPVNLYRSAVSTLQTDSAFIGGSTISSAGFIARNGNTLSLQNTAGDANVLLSNTGASSVQALRIVAGNGVGINTAIMTGTGLNLNASTTATGNSSIQFGTDTNLYRSAAANLKTDNNLTVGTIGSGGTNLLCYDGTNKLSTCSGAAGAGVYVAKNSADTSSAAVTAANYLYGFTNASSAIASGVLKLDNGNNTGTALTVVGTAGTLLDLQNPSGSSKFSVTNSGATAIGGGLTVATGNTFTNASSTLNTAIALGNLDYSGAGNTGTIGSNTTTVDVATSFTINETTANQTLTIPNPTNAAAGRIIYISNIGSASFTMLGSLFPAGSAATISWNGSAWKYAGSGGSAIENQNATDQTANFRISGTGQATTSFISPAIDALSGGTLSFGTSNATSVSIGKTTTNTTNQGTLTVNGLPNAASPTLVASPSGGTLLANTTYAYRLAAVYAGGSSEAVPSTPTSVTTGNGPNNNLNTLTWSSVAGVASYNVYRSSNGGTSWFVNNVSAGTVSIVDNGTNFTWGTSGTPPTTDAQAGITLNGGGGVAFYSASGGNVVLQAAPTAVTSYALNLPTSQGATNTVLLNDGSGNLTWVGTAGCSTCVATVPASTAQNTVAPTAAGVVSLSLKGTTSATTAHVLDIYNANATPTLQAYFDANGALNLNTGNTFTNASSTVFSAPATIADKPTGGAIGTAATTVDVATSFNVNQTTANQTLSLPTPTASATAGRVAYVSNVGSVNFTMTYGAGGTGSLVIAPSNTAAFYYNGTVWTSAGVDGSGANFIQNQFASAQTSSNFFISGSGKANTSLLSPLFDAATAGGLNIGTGTATGITIGKVGVSTGVAGPLTVVGDVNVNSGKFTVTAATGATAIAGATTISATTEVNTSNAKALYVHDAATHDNVLVVNTVTGSVGIDTAPNTSFAFNVSGNSLFSGTTQATGTAKATQFIDNDNAAYFLDPASATVSATLSSGINIGTVASAANVGILFGEATDRTISVETRTTNAAGNKITITSGGGGPGAGANAGGLLALQGGAGGGTNGNGGSVQLVGGAKNGSGTDGNVLLAYNGTNQLGNVAIGQGTAAARLDILNTGTTYTGTGLQLSSTFNPSAGGTASAAKIITTNNSTSTASTSRGLAITATDATALANTNIGLFVDQGTANANDLEIAAILNGQVRIAATGTLTVRTGLGYTPNLDVTGNINASNALYVGDTQVCTSSGCNTSGNFVRLQAATPAATDTGGLHVSGQAIADTLLSSASVVGTTSVTTPLVDTTSSGTLGLGTASGTGSVTIGKSSSPGTLLLQGGASSTTVINNGTNTTTLGFTNPGSGQNDIFNFPSVASGTYGICVNVSTTCSAFQAAGSFVRLQATTPPASDAGGVHVTGQLIADQLLSTAGNVVATSGGAAGGVYTGGAAAGNQRIDSSGNLVNIGNITGAAAVQIASTGGSNALTLSSGTGTIGAGSNNFTTTGTVTGGGLVSTGDIAIQNQADNAGNLTKRSTAGAGAVATFDVVITANVASAPKVQTTTTDRDTRVYGVVKTGVAGGNPVDVVISGNYQVNVATADAVTIGDQLVTGTVAGQVKVDNNAITGIVGYATAVKAGGVAGPVSLFVRPHNGQSTPFIRSTSSTAFQIQDATAANTLLTFDASGSTTGKLTVTGNITGAVINGTTGLNTGTASSNAGTQRIDATGNFLNAASLVFGSGTAGAAGSISGGSTYSGSGDISTSGGNINTTSGNIQTGGTTRITTGGNLTNIGDITGSGQVTLTSGGAGALIFDSGSNVIQLAANETTIQRTTTGSNSNYTIDLKDATTSTNTLFKILNSDATNVANLDVEGGINIGSGQTYKINGTALASSNLSDTANIAKLNAGTLGTPQLFSGVNTFGGSGDNTSYGTLFKNATNSTTAFAIQNQTAGATALSADTTNSRVGINKAAPAYTLDVAGDVNISTGSFYRYNTTPGITLGSACTAGQALLSSNVQGGITTAGTCTAITTCASAFCNGGSAFGATTRLGTTDAQDLLLITGTGGLNERLRISNSNGNISIGGNVTPLYRLEVSAGSAATQLKISNGTTDQGAYITNTAASDGYFSQGASYNATNWVAKATSASIQGSSGGTFTVGVDTGLTVGSTFTPTTRLSISPTVATFTNKLAINDISGTTGATVLCYNASNQVAGCANGAGTNNFIVNGVTLQTATFNIQSGASAGTATATIEKATSQTGDLLKFVDTNGSTVLAKVDVAGKVTDNGFVSNANSTVVGSVSTNASAALDIQNSSAVSTLFARNDNKVGIANNAPATTLDVLGSTTSRGVTSVAVAAPGAPAVTNNSTGLCSYTYGLTSVTSTGESALGATASVSLLGGNPPNITIAWTGVTGAIGFNIYRTASGGIGCGSTTGRVNASLIAANTNGNNSYTSSDTSNTLGSGVAAPAADTSYDYVAGGTAGINLTCGTNIGIKSINVKGGIVTAGVCTTNTLTDLAEQYNSTQALSPAEIVAVDHINSEYVVRSSTQNQDDIIGVVSTAPNQVLGADNPGYPIALSGRVPVKVGLENGPIVAGDRVTSSSVAGVGMRATTAGRIVGVALSGYDGTQTDASVIVFVNPGYWQPTADSSLQSTDFTRINCTGDMHVGGNLTVDGTTTTKELVVSGAATIQNVTVAGTATIASLKVSGDAEFGGNVSVAGNADVAGDINLSAAAGQTRNAITKKFKASKAIAAGEVVIGDPANDGQVTTTTTANDTKVLGVATADAVAGADLTVAIGGTVQVKTAAAVLANGDLLTSSIQEGMADKAPVVVPGAIIGKALGKTDATGMVWVLVTLH